MMRVLFPCALAMWFFTGSLPAGLEEIAWPAIEDARLPLWTPDSAEARPDGGWPAIVYYHGTHGRPTIDLVRRATGGRDFVLVGMTYVQRGRFLQSEEGIAAELVQLTELKKVLVGKHQVDPARIHVAGFSKGGWFASLLLERDRSLAGGMVLGAGVFHSRQAPEVDRFDGAKQIYIGVGRRDGNYPQSLRALVHFRKLGAEVILEAWPRTGHAHPDKVPLGMAQWLRLQAHGSPDGGGRGLPPEASDWMARRSLEIRQIAKPVERWYAWKAFLEAPYVRVSPSGSEARLAREKLVKLEKKPLVEAEKRWEDELQAILRREMNDRYVTTLRRVRQRYRELSERAAGTMIGELARDDAERTAKLLGTAPPAAGRER